MTTTTRRAALQTMGMSLLGISLIQQYSAANGAIIATEEASFQDWLHDLTWAAQQLQERSMSPLQWQERMDYIYRSASLRDLKLHLGFPKLADSILDRIPAGRQEYFQQINLTHPQEEWLRNSKESRRRLITKIAHIRKGECIPPHGHSNMVSAFLCLSGEFEVRLYDRLQESEEDMIVRQTRHDLKAGPGTWSSISDYRDNVHWLHANTDDCFLLTCKLMQVEESRPLKGRIHLNLRDTERLGAEIYRASKIDYARAQDHFLN